MKKPLIPALALLGSLYAANANAESLPFTPVDDGRPRLIESLDKCKGNCSRYLDIDTSLRISDYSMIKSGLDYGDFVEGIDVPPMDFSQENTDKLNELITGINSYKDLGISSTSSAQAKMGFGIVSKDWEVHAEGGFEGKMDYRMKGSEEITWGMLGIGPEGFAAHFSGEQEIIWGVTYFDTFLEAKLVAPARFLNMEIKPFIGIGYKRRMLKYNKVTLAEYVGSNDDVIKQSYDGWGNGLYFDMGIIADISRWLPDVKPKLGIAVENAGFMLYSGKPDWLGAEPATLVIALKLSPKGLFDISQELRVVGLNPEYRAEIGRKFGKFEIAMAGRINELTLAGVHRHSANLFFGYEGKFFGLGTYLSYDNEGKVGFGTAISFHLEEQ